MRSAGSDSDRPHGRSARSSVSTTSRPPVARAAPFSYDPGPKVEPHGTRVDRHVSHSERHGATVARSRSGKGHHHSGDVTPTRVSIGPPPSRSAGRGAYNSLHPNLRSMHLPTIVSLPSSAHHSDPVPLVSAMRTTVSRRDGGHKTPTIPPRHTPRVAEDNDPRPKSLACLPKQHSRSRAGSDVTIEIGRGNRTVSERKARPSHPPTRHPCDEPRLPLGRHDEILPGDSVSNAGSATSRRSYSSRYTGTTRKASSTTSLTDSSVERLASAIVTRTADVRSQRRALRSIAEGSSTSASHPPMGGVKVTGIVPRLFVGAAAISGDVYVTNKKGSKPQFVISH